MNVGIAHTEVQIPRYPGVKCRQTIIWLHSDANEKLEIPEVHVEGTATCSPHDMFSKKMGRRLALQKFRGQFEDDVIHDVTGMPTRMLHLGLSRYFSREDRRNIYTVIMPGMNHRAKGRKKRKPELAAEYKGDSLSGVHKIEGDSVLHPPPADGERVEQWCPFAG